MRHSFTPTARAAALQRRRALSEEKAARFGTASIVAVRLGNAFGWEARQYGGVIVGRSEGQFETADLARMAGAQATLTVKA